MTHLLTRTIPFPSFITGRKKKIKSLCSLNNVGKWYRYKKTEIKDQFQQNLIDMYIPEPTEQYEYLTLHLRCIRHNKRKFDFSDNAAYGTKWIKDTLEHLGYIKDDQFVDVHYFKSIIDTSLPETMFEISIYSGSESWQKN